MNYSEIEEKINFSLINNIEVDNNSAKTIINDYNNLKNGLIEYKKKFTELLNQKETYDNYIKNLLNNHLNIINIIDNNDNNLINSFNEYQSNIKENYEKWINNDYLINIKLIEENIENIENKLKDFTKLFSFIIKNIFNEKDIAKNICSICFENEIDICFNPCGHTTCNACILSNRNNKKCYICRTTINEYIKIYFLI